MSSQTSITSETGLEADLGSNDPITGNIDSITENNIDGIINSEANEVSDEFITNSSPDPTFVETAIIDQAEALETSPISLIPTQTDESSVMVEVSTNLNTLSQDDLTI